jgi:hypothetical protein
MNEQELRTDLKSEMLARVARTPTPVRGAETRRRAVLVGAAVAVALGIFMWKAGPVPTGRQSALVFGTSSGIAILAVASLWLALDRGGSMLGRSRSRLLVVPLTSPLVVVVWRSLWTERYAPGLDGWDRCLSLALMTGTFPLLALLFSRRGTDPVHPGASGASIGAAVGFVVALLVDLSCSFGGVAHVTLGHVAPVIFFSLAGAAIGKTMLAPSLQ